VAIVHPTAVVESGAELADDVTVGPYTIIRSTAKVGAGTRIGPHVVIGAYTRIGINNVFYQFSSIGEDPQDKKYGGEATFLEIGDNNTFREFCTLNRGTAQDAGTTRIGSHNWVMAYVHVAHDCQIGNHTIFANNAQLAGHVHVGDFAILGGFTVVHQFCRIGAHSLTAMGTILLQDLPPFVTASGNPAEVHGINSEGLRRRQFSAEAISALRRAYKQLYKEGLTLKAAREELRRTLTPFPELELLPRFLEVSGRGIVR
jgi:UDP-N-acetylglucosamine acyltransferase